ncbi:MAG: ImmA/IrrE family metallo-endopeptidase [Bacteroidota bacterium]
MTLLQKRAVLCTSAVQQILADLEQETGPLLPPIPLNAISERLGFQVVQLSAVADACSALVSTKDKLIGLNAHHAPRRQRFSLGHELGHILLKHPSESRCTLHEIILYNLEADACAADLLMPRDLVKQWSTKLSRADKLARVFDVSEEAMQRRLKELNIVARVGSESQRVD